jgi:hypothetical protein
MRPNKQFASMVIAALLTFVLRDSAWAQCTLPFTLSNGQPPDATKVMANFNALAACLNPGGSANSIQYNSGSGTLAGVGPLANGQLLIGSSGNAPQAQTLTAGSGIAITNGAGSVTIAATGGAVSTDLYRQVMSSTPTVATTGLSNWVNQGTTIFQRGPGRAVAQRAGHRIQFQSRWSLQARTSDAVHHSRIGFQHSK